MTNDEVKKKIVEILDSTPCLDCGYCKYSEFSELNVSYCRKLLLADALIAAGIGDVKVTEHRAEVAERALKLACKTIAPSYVDTAKLYFVIFIEQAEKELSKEQT